MSRIKSIIMAVALAATGMSLAACGETVKPGEVGVRVKAWGGGIEGPLPQGFHGKGIAEDIVTYPTIQRTYTYTRESDERGPENEEVAFADNNALPMTADVQAVLSIDPGAAKRIYTKYRLTFDQLLEGPIRNDIRTAIAAETEQVGVDYLYKGGRQEVIRKALIRVQKKWTPDGVIFSQLDWIGTIRYPDVIMKSIQAKTKADADTAAAQARVAVAKAEAESIVESARGQAEANRLLAASISANPEIVQLKAIEAWGANGAKMPSYWGGGAMPFINVK